MNHKEFNKVIREIQAIEKDLLITKAGEYANDDERLSNFINGAEFMASGRTPEAACWNWMAKHLVATRDAIDQIDLGIVKESKFWEEKLGDIRIYTGILTAIIRERIDNETK